MKSGTRLRVLVVDDSALARQLLTTIINAQPDMEVVGTATTAATARDRLQALRPDVMTLDINLPDGSGLDLLAEVMARQPLPVLVVATPVTDRDAVVRQARASGAFALIDKPRMADAQDRQSAAPLLCRALRAAALSRRPAVGASAVGATGAMGAAAAMAAAGGGAGPAAAAVSANAGLAALSSGSAMAAGASHGADMGSVASVPAPGTSAGAAPMANAPVLAAPLRAVPVAPPPAPLSAAASQARVIVVGASTGGPEAIEQFLAQMPLNCPGILIVQHMPVYFTQAFADRLNRTVAIAVRLATDGEPVQPGTALIAPGDQHLALRSSSQGGWRATLSSAPPLNRHRPAVDVLFDSAARVLGPRAIGVIMTGMGKDGAAGMLAMRQAGAMTFAQDEASCVVFGMPREAIAVGGAREVAPLNQLPGRVLAHAAQPLAATPA
ncbi:chemotaxis-specific protein-glutamate methyltransferase CheB [Pseudacidovorax intermedius]|uniref:Protein-glutamate methylesterase/protein-glutamine glutaminase n=1 Tax=Pseudacidovorax intermedius TaxID=433924 RepID=A0A147GMT3_9BURK|nr:chemotaxis-specific protein-glutamate methyltransferase CheB [Pseudacidovorax intermedius]KTT14648.1 hypothetical protein NS331_22865 [Pseudacidovorax intermedius]